MKTGVQERLISTVGTHKVFYTFLTTYIKICSLETLTVKPISMLEAGSEGLECNVQFICFFISMMWFVINSSLVPYKAKRLPPLVLNFSL